MVKRYNCDDYLTESAMGCWVGYADYVSLEARHRDLVAAAKELLNTQVGTNEHGDALNELYEVMRKSQESP